MITEAEARAWRLDMGARIHHDLTAEQREYLLQWLIGFLSRDPDFHQALETYFELNSVCGCPTREGMVYHQRGTCIDPVAARLGWYAGTVPE